MDVHDILQRLKGHSCSQDKVKFTPHDAVSHLLNPTPTTAQTPHTCMLATSQPLRCGPQYTTKANETHRKYQKSNPKPSRGHNTTFTTFVLFPSFTFHLPSTYNTTTDTPSNVVQRTSPSINERLSNSLSFVRSFVVVVVRCVIVVVVVCRCPTSSPASESVSQSVRVRATDYGLYIDTVYPTSRL